MFNTNNGPFSFSGVLSPGTYRLLCNSSVYAAAGGSGVPLTGDFTVTSEYDASLVLGCAGVITQPQSVSICSLGSATFSLFAVGVDTLSYQWQMESPPGTWVDLADGPAAGLGTIQGATNFQLEVIFPDAGTNINLRCVVTAAGCRSTTSQTVQLSVCDYPGGDLNCDGQVDLIDLATLLTNVSTQSGATYEQGDIDHDGDVDRIDLSTLLALFGSTCP